MTLSVSSSIDTSAIDGWRQGVEITQQKFYDAGTVKIWSGQPGHRSLRIDYGDTETNATSVYLDESHVDPIELINVQHRGDAVHSTATTFPISNKDSLVVKDSIFDGTIEPLTIRPTHTSYTSVLKRELHSVNGLLSSGNEDTDLNSDMLLSIDEFATNHISAFNDDKRLQTPKLVLERHSNLTGGVWNIAEGPNGVLLAVSRTGDVATSVDCDNWNITKSLLSDLTWTDVIFGNGVYIAVSLTLFAVSADLGKTWTYKTPPLTSCNGIVYGQTSVLPNHRFVAINAGFSTFSTDNGNTWSTPSTTFEFSNAVAITFGNDTFVAVSDSGGIVYGNDGTTWTSNDLGTEEVPSNITFGGGIFVVIASTSNFVAYTTTPSSWTITTLPLSSGWFSMCYYNGLFIVASSLSNDVVTSNNGASWNLTSSTCNAISKKIGFTTNSVVIIGNLNLSVSQDGLLWRIGGAVVKTFNANIVPISVQAGYFKNTNTVNTFSDDRFILNFDSHSNRGVDFDRATSLMTGSTDNYIPYNSISATCGWTLKNVLGTDSIAFGNLTH